VRQLNRATFTFIAVLLFFSLFSNRLFSSILPLATTNEWVYEFVNRSPGSILPPSNLSMTMGLSESENFGNLCIQPLAFDANQLVLYFGNQDEVVVLYGFKANINQRNVEFFFNTGDALAVYSGVVLSGLEDSILLEEQKGKQTRLISDQEIKIEWEVRNKSISRELNVQSYTGQVNSVSNTLSAGELFTIEFSLFLGPCSLEGGCNAGIFTFTFLPDVGLTKMHLRGDHPEFGGQFDHIYSLLVEPDDSFNLESVENQVDSVSCQPADKNSLKKSSLGKTANWFNIFLLIVIVLKAFSVFYYRFFQKELQ